MPRGSLVARCSGRSGPTCGWSGRPSAAARRGRNPVHRFAAVPHPSAGAAEVPVGGRLVYRITDFHPECLIAAQDGHRARWRRCWPDQLLAAAGRPVRGAWARTRCAACMTTGIPAERIALVRDGSPVAFTDGTGMNPCRPSSAARASALFGKLRRRPRGRDLLRGLSPAPSVGKRAGPAVAQCRRGGRGRVARLSASSLPFHARGPCRLSGCRACSRRPMRIWWC